VPLPAPRGSPHIRWTHIRWTHIRWTHIRWTHVRWTQHRDGFLGVDENLVSNPGRHQRDTHFFHAGAGVHHRQIVGQQLDDADRNSLIRARDAHVAMTFRHIHATVLGSSRSGCSKNTCTSSHNTW
jgi:hypothetical protein